MKNNKQYANLKEISKSEEHSKYFNVEKAMSVQYCTITLTESMIRQFLIQDNIHQKDVIDRLSRKIQKLKYLNNEYVKDNQMIFDTCNTYETRINNARIILEHDSDYDDGDFESRKFQDDILKALEVERRWEE